MAQGPFYTYYEYGKLIIAYETNHKNLEINNKVRIIGDLCHQLMLEHYEMESVPEVLIELFHDYTKPFPNAEVYTEKADSNAFAWVGMDTLTSTPWNEHAQEQGFKDWLVGTGRKKKVGIKIVIRASAFKAISVLKLLDFALQNIAYLQTIQQEDRFGPTVELSNPDATELEDSVVTVYKFVGNSAPRKRIQSILAEDNERVTDVATTKLYWLLSADPRANRKLDYFYQNDQFHFYHKEDSAAGLLLSLNHVQEIVKDSIGNRFIFPSDWVFFFIDSADSEAIGPFQIESEESFRWPISSISIKNNPKRWVFPIGTDVTHEISFFPKEQLVLKDVGVTDPDSIRVLVEEALYSGEKSIIVADEEDTSPIDTRLLISLLLVTVGGILTFWLIRLRQRIRE